MNTPTAPVAPVRRSYVRWVVIGLVVLMTPVLFLGFVAYSVLALDRDAAALRREVMTASGSDWHTKVQLDLGWATLGLARSVLHFVHHEHIDEARLALASVRSASVGVYQREARNPDVNAGRLLAHADQVMERRGWTRLVGVVDHGQTVLVYTNGGETSGAKVDLCLAVLDGQELVVCATRVDSGALAELVAKHAPDGFRKNAKFAKLFSKI